MTDAPTYRGFLWREPGGATLRGELRDVFGYVLHITGAPHGDGAWRLTATVEIPAALEVEAIDREGRG